MSLSSITSEADREDENWILNIEYRKALISIYNVLIIFINIK
jgi:hypothetical protein